MGLDLEDRGTKGGGEEPLDCRPQGRTAADHKPQIPAKLFLDLVEYQPVSPGACLRVPSRAPSLQRNSNAQCIPASEGQARGMWHARAFDAGGLQKKKKKMGVLFNTRMCCPLYHHHLHSIACKILGGGICKILGELKQLPAGSAPCMGRHTIIILAIRFFLGGWGLPWITCRLSA